MRINSIYHLFRSAFTVIPLFSFLGLLMWSSVVFCGSGRWVTGIVKDQRGPIANAVVRVQTTEYHSITDESGRFSLHIPSHLPLPLKLTAWYKGYYCGGPVELKPEYNDIVIDLHAHFRIDNINYRWLPSIGNTTKGKGENQACSTCHSGIEKNLNYLLPVDEWLRDAHSQSARNPRFLTIYAGTDTIGNKSPNTRYVHERDYGTLPLPPVQDSSYFGPGYKLDFPSSQGNCACCHIPVASVKAPYEVNPLRVSGIAEEGVSCDFCHKIWDVRLDPQTRLPYANAPGVLSYVFRRPPDGQQFFAGPYDDVAPGEDTYLSLQRESAFCAGCHFGVFWDTVIYNSYGEWLASPYNSPDNGRTCQDCHMPRRGVKYFALPEKGGLERDPNKIFSHQMPGALDKDLLSNAVTMTVSAKRARKTIEVKVTIVNDLTGHHVPTDSPLRHMLLLVKAKAEGGRLLEIAEGPKLPEWCGVGDVSKGYYAGMPGKVFAKVLEERWTSVVPTAAYWNPTIVVSDNRLAAFARDTSNYSFSIDTSESVTVDVSLLYRRAYKKLMDLKGWKNPDIVMERQILTVEPMELK